jgi:hypothetical protein
MAMFNLLPIQLALSPGESVVLWQSRMPENKSRAIPIIEILPENHTGVKLNYYHRRGVFTYDRYGMKNLINQKGKWIDFYC